MAKKAKAKTADRGPQIDAGLIETKNLAECLKVDFAALYSAIFPTPSKKAAKQIAEFQSLGILKRMDATAGLILATHGTEAMETLTGHTSDTARGWAAFIMGQLPDLSLAARLKRIRPYADDSHFGVREWAWMAVRRHIATDLAGAIKILAGWTDDDSFRVRRFASEATRPRGVWAEHINALKDKPELGLPILAPIKDDAERYVQDSVANWLNDAAKSKPAWVKEICKAWTRESDSKATAYVVKRAQRSLK